MRPIFGLVLGMFALLCSPAWADSWLPPSTRTYLSEDGQWRLTVVPRGIVTPLRYFEEKVSGMPKSGGEPGTAQQPMGHMERRLPSGWQAAWSAPLVNETAPVDAIVSTQGLAVTFDNWHSAGYGADVVVIYDGEGRKVRALALEEFLPADYLRALPTSISSRWWGSKHGFSPDGQQLVLQVVVPQKEGGLDRASPPEYVEVKLEMATGGVVPPQGSEWDRAMTAARTVVAERAAMLAREYEKFKAPLTAPTSTDEGEWRQYLSEAYFRVAPDADPVYPKIGFVTAAGPEFRERDQRLVRKVLEAALDIEGAVVVLGCPDSAQLVGVLGNVVAQLPPQGLRLAHVYAAVTPALREAAAQAVAPSGAAFIAIDIGVSIPQSPERLKQFSRAMGELR